MLKFIDLFAGVGGMRMAFENAGTQCVFSSEIDKFAAQAYFANFGEMPHGDITKIHASEIPPFDILIGGFPCQPFSSAGQGIKKTLGQKMGLECEKGNLFREIVRILDHHKPVAFLLENVKNIRSIDQGRAFKTIMDALSDVGYNIKTEVLNAKYYVPQNRERVFFAGFNKDMIDNYHEFKFPYFMPENLPKLKNVLETNPDDSFTLTDKAWEWHQKHKAKHCKEGRSGGYGYNFGNLESHARTITTNVNNFLIQQENKNPRMLTPRECARLQGFPESFKIVCSKTQAYKQFGNSVAIPLVTDIARNLIDFINNNIIDQSTLQLQDLLLQINKISSKSIV